VQAFLRAGGRTAGHRAVANPRLSSSDRGQARERV